MEERIVVFKRLAKKSGGDRYETSDGRFVVYIPQEISRPRGKPVEEIRITFHTGDEE